MESPPIDYSCDFPEVICHDLIDGFSFTEDFKSSSTYSLLVNLDPTELNDWKNGYQSDPHFSKVLEEREDDLEIKYTQYQLRSNGLLYFEDWNGNYRLCVPESMRLSVMSQSHNEISEAAHGGHAKTYNHIAAIYYWPKMAREIKKYVSTCDICQKAKPRRHAPAGLLQPIPIPSQPFEVVTMDFIPELPLSEGYDNILVIVDKLTKYAIFIPTTVNITEVETARLFFHHVISQFGIPKQIITD